MTGTDSFLAERLMGWEPFEGVDPPYQGKVFRMPSGQLRIIIDHYNMRLPEKFVPTQDITQALGDGGPDTIAGKMWERGWELVLIRTIGTKTAAKFVVYETLEEFQKIIANVFEWTWHIIPATAISNAAKAALEGEGK